jgi:hypothetical protein
VTTPDPEHGWQLTGSSADADLEDVLEPYVDGDGLALPIESHVAVVAAS